MCLFNIFVFFVIQMTEQRKQKQRIGLLSSTSAYLQQMSAQ